MADRTVTTLHGRQDVPDLKPLYLGFSEMPLVSISNDQRWPIANANFVAIVHHGIPTNLHTPIHDSRGGYLAFLGRISPEKRPDRAIRIARTLGIPLKIAAKVDKADEAYFREKIAPLLSDPGIEFIGEIDERTKTKFLGEALALLFPVDWPGPFGLVMIEAMACGTPVLARPSISERETTVPLPRPVLEKRLNGQGLRSDRARRAAERGVDADFAVAPAMIFDCEVGRWFGSSTH